MPGIAGIFHPTKVTGYFKKRVDFYWHYW